MGNEFNPNANITQLNLSGQGLITIHIFPFRAALQTLILRNNGITTVQGNDRFTDGGVIFANLI